MLTDRELRAIRATQEEVLPEVVSVTRATRTSDGFGGQHDAVWVEVFTSPARVTQAQTLDMGGQAGRTIEIEKWTVRLPYGTDVREHDRIIWGDVTIRVDEVKHRTFETVTSVDGERVK